MGKGIAWLVAGLMFAAMLGGCIGGEKQNPSNESSSKGRIYGTVTNDTGMPVAGATLSVENQSYAASTGADGKYEIANVEHGTYVVVCTASGYSGQNQSNIVVEANRDTEVNFQLNKIYSQSGTGMITWYLHNPGGQPQTSPDTGVPPGVYASRVGTIDANKTWCSSPQKDYSVNPVNPVVLVWLSGDFWLTPELGSEQELNVDVSKPGKCVMFAGADAATGTPATQLAVRVDLRLGGATGNSGTIIADGGGLIVAGPGATTKVEFDLAWTSDFDGIISGPVRVTVWLGGKAVDNPVENPGAPLWPRGAGVSVQSYHVYDTAEYPESVTITLKQ